MCEEYVCAQNGVNKISEIPYGAGYKAVKQEFEKSMRKITMMNYGLILVAHSETVMVPGPNDTNIEIQQPQLPKRAYDVCNGLVDIIGYITTEWENGGSHQYLYTMATPTIRAGSRFGKFLNPKICFDENGYVALTNALANAIEKMEDSGASMTDTAAPVLEENISLSFNEISEEAEKIWKSLVAKSDTQTLSLILDKAEEIFGRRVKLSEITEKQKDLFYLLLEEMRELTK